MLLDVAHGKQGAGYEKAVEEDIIFRRPTLVVDALVRFGVGNVNLVWRNANNLAIFVGLVVGY